MNKTLTEAAREFANIVRGIEPRLSRLDPARPLERLVGKLICLRAVVPWLLRTINRRRVFGSNPITGPIRTALYLWNRHRTKRRTGRRSLATHLRVAVLPFEEQHSIDSERLKSCRVGMPYENVDTGQIEIIPHCVWYPYRNVILRKIATKYGSTRSKKKAA